MVIRKKMARFVCGLGIISAICGIPIVSQAGNSYLDVRASGITNVSSKDPYSQVTAKDDNDQNYYIKLDSLSGGPHLFFYAFNHPTRTQVSTGLKVDAVAKTFSHRYDIVSGVAGKDYYVYAVGAPGCADVHGVGRYCP